MIGKFGQKVVTRSRSPESNLTHVDSIINQKPREIEIPCLMKALDNVTLKKTTILGSNLQFSMASSSSDHVALNEK